MPWTYILECRGGAFYVGSTARELESRVWQHNHDDQMAANFTRKRRPVRLVYAEWFDAVELAFEREKQLQGWRREKKLALIASQWEDLTRLAQSGEGRWLRHAQPPRATKVPEPVEGTGTRSGPGGFDRLNHLERRRS